MDRERERERERDSGCWSCDNTSVELTPYHPSRHQVHSCRRHHCCCRHLTHIHNSRLRQRHVHTVLFIGRTAPLIASIGFTSCHIIVIELFAVRQGRHGHVLILWRRRQRWVRVVRQPSVIVRHQVVVRRGWDSGSTSKMPRFAQYGSIDCFSD